MRYLFCQRQNGQHNSKESYVSRTYAFLFLKNRITFVANNMVTLDKGKYTDWAAMQENMPVFFRPWYLDCVCIHGQWDAILATSDKGQIEGALVFYTVKRYGRPFIIMPPLTPFGGIWIAPSNASKYTYKIQKESRIISKLLEAIPKDVVLYRQSFWHSYKNWLPFYWKAFEQTTRYTFIINDLKSWSLNDTATNVRNKINKASATLNVSFTDDTKLVYNQVNNIMTKKGLPLIWSHPFFADLDKAVLQHAYRLILTVTDNDNRLHASAYIIIDKDTAYLMMLGSDPVLRQSGAIPLVIYHAILAAAEYVNKFDFEGSSMESLFDLFSGFGGQMTPFYSIYRTKNIFWDLIYRVKSRKDNRNK